MISTKIKNTIFLIIPVIGVLIYVIHYHTKIPIMHDWIFLDTMVNSTSSEWLNKLWQPSNGHRSIIVQLFYLVNYWVFDFNLSLTVYINYVVLLASLLGLWNIFKKTINLPTAFFLPVPWLFLIVSQSENMLIAWQLAYNLGVFGAIWTFYFLSVEKNRSIWYALFFYLISFYSFGNGLFLLPAGLLYLIFSKSGLKKILLWLFIGCAITIFYFIDYNSGSAGSSILEAIHNIDHVLLFSLSIIGLSFGSFFGYLGVPFIFFNVFIGLLLFVFFVILITLSIRHRILLNNRHSILLVTILLYGLMVIGIISLGRVTMGIESSFARKYVTTSVFFSLGLYFLTIYLYKFNIFPPFQTKKNLRFIKNALFFVFVLSYIVSTIYGIFMAEYSLGNRITYQYAICNINNVPKESFPLDEPSKAYIEPIINKLKSLNKFNFCAGNFINNTLLNTIPLPKLRSTNKNQKVCGNYFYQLVHVENITVIYSISIRMTDSMSDASYVNLIIRSSTQKLLEQHLNIKGMLKNDLLYLELDNPIAMTDEEFITIEFEALSDDICMPMFPAYYNGLLAVNGEKQKEVLGIEFNLPDQLHRYYQILGFRNKLVDFRNNLRNRKTKELDFIINE